MDTQPPPGESPLPPVRNPIFRRLADLWNSTPRIEPGTLQYRALVPFIRMMVVLLILMAGVIGLRVAAITYARQVTRLLVEADSAVHRALDVQQTAMRISLRELAYDPHLSTALDDASQVADLEAEMGEFVADGPADVAYLADKDGQVIACHDAVEPCSGEAGDIVADVSLLPGADWSDESANVEAFVLAADRGPILVVQIPVPTSNPLEGDSGAILGAEIPIADLIAATAGETRTHVLIYTAPAAPIVSESGPDLRPLSPDVPILSLSAYERAFQLYRPGAMRASDVIGVRIGPRRYHAAFTPLTLEGVPRGVLGLLVPNPTIIPLRVLASDTIFFLLMAMLLSGAIVGGALISTSLVQPALSRVETENARMMAILSSVVDGVVLRNPEGHIILANPAAVDLLSTQDGFFPETLEGLTLDEKPDPAPFRIELGGRTISVSVAPVLTPDGGRLGEVLVLRDVTQEAIVERTKDNFIAQISHELRTPLTVIRGYVDLLRVGGGGVPRPSRERAVDAILEQTDTLARMINESLELASLRNGESVPVDPTPVNLNTFVSMTITAWQPELAKTGLRPSTNWADPSPVVAIDTRRMRRAFDALLHNACRFSPEGGELRVTTAQGAGEVRISITDPGVGISDEDLPRIFDLFYRGEPVRQDGNLVDLRGFGQGLYIVKTIVEAHGGRVEVESARGAGSTFTVVLPALKADAAPGV